MTEETLPLRPDPRTPVVSLAFSIPLLFPSTTPLPLLESPPLISPSFPQKTSGGSLPTLQGFSLLQWIKLIRLSPLLTSFMDFPIKASTVLSSLPARPISQSPNILCAFTTTTAPRIASPEVKIAPEHLYLCASRMAFLNSKDRSHALHSSQEFFIMDAVLKDSSNNFMSSGSSIVSDDLGKVLPPTPCSTVCGQP